MQQRFSVGQVLNKDTPVLSVPPTSLKPELRESEETAGRDRSWTLSKRNDLLFKKHKNVLRRNRQNRYK